MSLLQRLLPHAFPSLGGLHPLILWLAAVSILCGTILAAEPAGKAPGDEDARRDDTFKRLVANRRLSGRFTIDAAGGEPVANRPLEQEEYVITSANRIGGDVWLLMSRIKYGKTDLTVPVPVQVKWAGDTPVITLDNVGIPGLGTYSARVVVDQRRYAGTWSHDTVGGHLFGTITPAGDDAKKPAAGEADATPPRRPPRPVAE